jgi:hypothetical protein
MRFTVFVLGSQILARIGPVCMRVTTATRGRPTVLTSSSRLDFPRQRWLHGYRTPPDAAILPR